MRSKTSPETIRLIRRLASEGLPATEIARQTGVPYQLTWTYVQGFASLNKYREHLAQQQGFASRNEYQEHLVKKKGFASLTEYREHLAEQRQSRPANQELSDIIKNGLKLLGQNQSWLARELGLSRQMVSNYIHGKYLPRQELLEKIQTVLRIDYRSIDGLVEKG